MKGKCMTSKIPVLFSLVWESWIFLRNFLMLIQLFLLQIHFPFSNIGSTDGSRVFLGEDRNIMLI